MRRGGRGAACARARSTNAAAVVLNGERSQLANVHAVSDGYPLRGRCGGGRALRRRHARRAAFPRAGEVWPDSRLLAALDARVGRQLSIGAAQFAWRAC